jgi:hypothetical protein
MEWLHRLADEARAKASAASPTAGAKKNEERELGHGELGSEGAQSTSPVLTEDPNRGLGFVPVLTEDPNRRLGFEPDSASSLVLPAKSVEDFYIGERFGLIEPSDGEVEDISDALDDGWSASSAQAMADAGREALTPMPPCILSVDVIGDGEDEAAFNAEPAVEPAAERGEAEDNPFADVAASTVLEDGRLTLERREEERQAEADAEAAASDAATASTILEDGPRPHPAEHWHYHLVSGDVSHNMSVSGNVEHAFAAGPEEAALEAEPEATEEEVAAEATEEEATAAPAEATEEEATAAPAEATEEAAAQPVHSHDWWEDSPAVPPWEDSPAVPPQATVASDNPVALLAEHEEEEEEEEESDEEDEEDEEEYID